MIIQYPYTYGYLRNTKESLTPGLRAKNRTGSSPNTNKTANHPTATFCNGIAYRVLVGYFTTLYQQWSLSVEWDVGMNTNDELERTGKERCYLFRNTLSEFDHNECENHDKYQTGLEFYQSRFELRTTRTLCRVLTTTTKFSVKLQRRLGHSKVN
jgi:hypothetical protein